MHEQPNTPEWFDARKNKVTASQFASAIGLNPYESWYKSYRVFHGLEAKQFSPMALQAMEIGRKEEHLVAKAVEQALGVRLNRCPAFEREGMIATPDRMLHLRHGLIEVSMPVELKRPFMTMYNEPPLHYLMQLLFQMWTCNAERGLLCWWMPDCRPVVHMVRLTEQLGYWFIKNQSLAREFTSKKEPPKRDTTKGKRTEEARLLFEAATIRVI